MHDYIKEIDKNNEIQGYETGYIYTPTFINSETRRVIAFSDRELKKDELIKLAQGGDLK